MLLEAEGEELKKKWLQDKLYDLFRGMCLTESSSFIYKRLDITNQFAEPNTKEKLMSSGPQFSDESADV